MLKYIGSSWLLTILQVVVMFKLTPFMLGRLGEEPYGVWLQVVALTGVLKLLIAGVPMASVRFLSQAIGRKDENELRRVVSTCFAMCAGLGALALIVGAAVSLYFTGSFLEKPNVAALGLADSATFAYWVVVASTALGFVMRLPYGILEAYHDFHHRNAIMAGELFLRFGLSIGLLMFDASIEMLALAMIGSQVAEFVVSLGVLKRRHPEVSFGLSHYDRTLLRSILGFSLFALLLNMGAQLAFRADAIVIGQFMPNAADITDYDMGNKFFEYLIALVLGIGMVIMPYATRLRASGNRADLRDVFLKYSKIALSLSLCVGLFLLILGPEFLEWWLQDEYSPRSGKVTQILVVSFFAFLPIRGVALPMLMGLGEPRRPAMAFLGMGLLNVALSIALISSYGLIGVALGTGIPNVLFAVYVMRLACEETDIRIADYLRHVFGRPLLGSLAPIAFLALCKWGLQVQGFAPIFGAGVGMVGVFSLAWVFFVYRGDPHYDLRLMLGAKLRRQ